MSEHKLKLFNKTKPMARIFRDLCLADMMTKVTNDRCDASVDMLAKEVSNIYFGVTIIVLSLLSSPASITVTVYLTVEACTLSTNLERLL